MRRLIRTLRHRGANRIQIHIHRTSQKPSFIDNSQRFKATFPKTPRLVILPMNVIAHDRVGKNINTENRGERFHASSNPLATKRKIFTCLITNTREKCTPNTALNGMDDANFNRVKLF